MVHDIGKTVLDQYVKEEFDEIMNRVNHDGMPFVEAERTILGFDHSQVGKVIAKKWNFPNIYIEVIGDHHHPKRALIAGVLCSWSWCSTSTGVLSLGLGSVGTLKSIILLAFILASTCDAEFKALPAHRSQRSQSPAHIELALQGRLGLLPQIRLASPYV